jgi:mRNA interferase YafQ
MRILLKIAQHSKFKSDSKKLIRSGKFSKADEKRLFDMIQDLAQEKKLDAKYKDHPLVGNWKNHRECHIKPDLLLIYRIEGNTLKLIRIGSHSELGL